MFSTSSSFFQRAIELDPNFAMAHLRLGIVYENTGQLTLAAEEVKKARLIFAKDRANTSGSI